VLRIKKALQYMEEKQYDVTINAVLILGIKFSMVLYASLHWVGCFCYMVAGLNNNDETTWTAYISANGEWMGVTAGGQEGVRRGPAGGSYFRRGSVGGLQGLNNNHASTGQRE
jgi:hypothetical protein